MSNYDDINMLIATYSGNERKITIPKIYLELTGDYPTAALLNQMIFWSDKTKRTDGFFYKTYEEWEEETTLSEYQVRRSSKRLKELGVLETKLKKANGSPTLHYKVNMGKLSESILNKLKNRNQTNLSNDSVVSQESLTVDDTVNDNSRKDSPDSAKAKYDDDSPYLKLANYLYTKIKENNSKAKEPNFQNWADDIRKLVELDENTVEEVKKVIDWSQADDFWKGNIMSASKLRKQFAKLWGQAGFDKTDHPKQESELWGEL